MTQWFPNWTPEIPIWGKVDLLIDDKVIGMIIAESINPITLSIHIYLDPKLRTPGNLRVLHNECMPVMQAHYKDLGIETVTAVVPMYNTKVRRLLHFLGMPTKGYYIGTVHI